MMTVPTSAIWRRHRIDHPSPFSAATCRPATAASVRARICADSPGVVITGGTKGFGYALARQFLSNGARVVVCGRDPDKLEATLASLQAEHPDSMVSGMPCDVSKPDDVSRFANFSQNALDDLIHFWINNAGEVTSKRFLADVQPDEILRVANTNVIGSLLCCREAVSIMRQQPSSSVPIYHIFNMGFSSWGVKFTRSSCTHKMTKIALTQLNLSLNEELKNEGISSIGVHNLSPGMVLTDLLLKDSTPISRRFFNVLAEEPGTVAATLVPCILNIEGTGKSIEYLSPLSTFMKLLVGFPQIFKGGRFFDANGDRVKVDGCSYQDNGVQSLY